MNKQIYAVLDTAAKDINSLMLFPNDAAAIRAFSEMLGQSEFMKRYAHDFTLIELGTLTINEDGHGKCDPGIHNPTESSRTVITARQLLDSQEASK